MSQHTISDANSHVFFSLLEYMEAEGCHIFQEKMLISGF